MFDHNTEEPPRRRLFVGATKLSQLSYEYRSNLPPVYRNIYPRETPRKTHLCCQFLCIVLCCVMLTPFWFSPLLHKLAIEWCGAASIRFNEEPERASRPFDKDRDGFVLAGKARSELLLVNIVDNPALHTANRAPRAAFLTSGLGVR